MVKVTTDTDLGPELGHAVSCCALHKVEYYENFLRLIVYKTRYKMLTNNSCEMDVPHCKKSIDRVQVDSYLTLQDTHCFRRLYPQ